MLVELQALVDESLLEIQKSNSWLRSQSIVYVGCSTA